MKEAEIALVIGPCRLTAGARACPGLEQLEAHAFDREAVRVEDLALDDGEWFECECEIGAGAGLGTVEGWDRVAAAVDGDEAVGRAHCADSYAQVGRDLQDETALVVRIFADQGTILLGLGEDNAVGKRE
jgi:hypothetical protein